ncbi:MAG: DUF2442 domain-containing protein [Chitinivibrionia bacterium]|jgi:hypothetical protein|nr:DUF2442 domain-containing protein [Chitinivibrionia bacterium]
MKDYFCYENTDDLIEAVTVKPLENYKLRVSFSNGKTKIFDFKPYLDLQIFQPLKDKSFFDTVKINFDTAFWEYDWKIKNAANNIDIAPERMYWDGVDEF